MNTRTGQTIPVAACREIGGRNLRSAPSTAATRIEVSFPPVDSPVEILINSREPTMNAMIIYDEGNRAREASARLMRASDRADEATQWNFSVWRADMLEHPLLAEEALEQAVEAHLLMLAVAPQKELPPALLKWLETWAAHRRVGDAAVALLNGGFGDTLSAMATPALLDLAERHSLSLIAGDSGPVDIEPPGLPQPRLEAEVAYTAAMTHSLAEPSWESCRHWGINE